MNPEILTPAVTLYSGDCLALMPQLPSQSVDLVLVDLPYGTTACRWDTILPFDQLWSEWARLLRPKGCVVMTASQPFTSLCVTSNLQWFKCEWVWDKVSAANYMLAKKQPMKVHENVLVFAPGPHTYNPQMVQGSPNHATKRRPGAPLNMFSMSGDFVNTSELKYPKSIQTFAKFPASKETKAHPTQKPVTLFRYLVETYSNPGAVVLDCCAGSGTTGEAAESAGRQAILMERDDTFCQTIRQRFQAPGV